MIAHVWDSGIARLPRMGNTPRKTIAENLSRLMRESADLKTIQALHERCGISTGTLDRIRRGAVSAGVDHLADIAAAFGLEPWQLLVPGVKQGTTSNPDSIAAARDLLLFASKMVPELPTNVVKIGALVSDKGGLRKTSGQKGRAHSSKPKAKKVIR